jgi:hypothetical protein
VGSAVREHDIDGREVAVDGMEVGDATLVSEVR